MTKMPTLEDVVDLHSFEPFGYKNPEPAFLFEGTITNIRANQSWQLVIVNEETGFF
ncbi:MAG: hypothetical protein ACPL3A_09280 [Thermoanaerobacteraceae bacterium]